MGDRVLLRGRRRGPGPVQLWDGKARLACLGGRRICYGLQVLGTGARAYCAVAADVQAERAFGNAIKEEIKRLLDLIYLRLCCKFP